MQALYVLNTRMFVSTRATMLNLHYLLFNHEKIFNHTPSFLCMPSSAKLINEITIIQSMAIRSQVHEALWLFLIPYIVFCSYNHTVHQQCLLTGLWSYHWLVQFTYIVYWGLYMAVLSSWGMMGSRWQYISNLWTYNIFMNLAAYLYVYIWMLWTLSYDRSV